MVVMVLSLVAVNPAGPVHTVLTVTEEHSLLSIRRNLTSHVRRAAELIVVMGKVILLIAITDAGPGTTV